MLNNLRQMLNLHFRVIQINLSTINKIRLLIMSLHVWNYFEIQYIIVRYNDMFFWNSIFCLNYDRWYTSLNRQITSQKGQHDGNDKKQQITKRMLNIKCKITKPNIYSTGLYSFDSRSIQNLILFSFYQVIHQQQEMQKKKKEAAVTIKQDKTNTISRVGNVSNIKYRKCINKDVKS